VATIKNIFKEEEIDELLDIYYSSDMILHRADQNLKRVFVTRYCKENKFSKKILDAKVDQSYFVEYPAGAYCTLHQDVKLDYCITTTITHLTDDYEGGESLVGDEVIKPKKGETVFYKQEEMHGVKPVKSGSRIVYVAWFIT